MKKYIILALFAIAGIGQMIPSLEVFSESSTVSSTQQYIKKAEQTVKSYIIKLEKSGFSNTDIISTLERVKTLYIKKRGDKNYTGIKKITIEAIISTLEKAIADKRGQSDDEEDLYDIFNSIPTVTNTYYSTGTTTNTCTTEYAPVCAMPKSSCSGTYCTAILRTPKTYDNKCVMYTAGATYLYSGACKTTIDPPSTPICSIGSFTSSNCICKNGKSPRSIESGTRVQMYTCEEIPTCSKEYAPVCAMPKSSCTSTYCTDVLRMPKTYDNKCMMYAAEATYLYSGACKTETPPPVCTKEYAPVCGAMESATNCTPDGKCYVADGLLMTFGNKCELEKAKAKYLYSGACKADTPTPVCATGTLTDPNCVCKDGTSPRPLASGTRIQAYTCDPIVVTPPACTKEYVPVCAMPKSSCNGTYCTDVMPTPKTYDNKCMMEVAGASYLYSGSCKTTPTTPICAVGNFASSNCVCLNGNPPTIVEGGTKLQMYTCDPIVTTQCTTEYAPVCGQYTPVCPIGMACLMAYPMPTTYANKCELLKARASYLYAGICTSDM